MVRLVCVIFFFLFLQSVWLMLQLAYGLPGAYMVMIPFTGLGF
jgi:hypothetical protein